MPQPIDTGFYSVAESLRESEELKKRQAQGQCYDEMEVMTAAEVLRSWGEELGIEQCVNVGKGNVTFIHRDLVTKGNLPIVMSRVYDSSLGNRSDFGLGWQLSLNESIVPSKGGALSYRDGCATVHRLSPDMVGFSVDPFENGDIRSVTLNARGVLQLGYLDGKQKQFKKFGNQYLLVSVLDQHSNRIELSYNNNQLSKVSGNHGQSIHIKRDQNR
jgi:hypothetical protein